jgi:molybdopterin-guanine dinucleotide biosynthesis protein A
MGPLSGIAEALAWSPHPWVLVLAVDLLDMDQVTLGALAPRIGTREGCVPRLEGRIEPLAALYPIAALRVAQRHLACGRLAARAFAETCVEERLVRWLDIPPRQAAAFRNANRPEDLADCSA